MRLESGSDEGLSMVEVVVAIAIVTTGLLALLGELATYIHQHSYQRARTSAVRFATTELEDMRGRPIGYLSALPQTNVDQPLAGGVSFTRTTTVQICKAGDPSCANPPQSGEPAVARVTVDVAWTDSRGDHHVALRSSDAGNDAKNIAGSTSGLVTSVTGVSGTSVEVTSMSLSPSATAVNSSGHPASKVTVTMQAVGLTSGTVIPVTWTDDNGAHQVSMNGDGATWSVDVPASDITRVVSASTGSVVFTATVPGVHTLPSATLTVLPPVGFIGQCTVSPAPISLVPLTRLTAVPEVVTCTTSGLTSADGVTATYASKSSTADLALTSLDGSTWRGTIVSGTSMASSGSSESFTFTLKRKSDGATATSSLSVALS